MAGHTPILNESEVKVLLQSVYDEENITPERIEIGPGCAKGDGFLSHITRVSAFSNSKNLHLVVKRAPKAEEFRKLTPTRLIFLREIRFYEETFPALTKFQAERNVDNPFSCVTKCYKTVSNEYEETVVLENICENNFVPWERTKEMGDAHISLVLEQYGKLHAISFAMQDQNPELYKKLSSNMENVLVPKYFNNAFFEGFAVAAEHNKAIFTDDENHAKEALEKFRHEIMDYLINEIGEYKGKYSVISHGDCWFNNMMFKYENENTDKPSDVCLLDFQFLRASSPVLDVSYFLYSGCSKAILDNLDHYLHVYHKSLSDHCKALGSDAEKLYPFSALLDDWKRYAKMGYLMGIMIIRVALQDREDLKDLNDVSQSGESVADTMVYKVTNKNCIERMRNLTLHMCERGFF